MANFVKIIPNFCQMLHFLPISSNDDDIGLGAARAWHFKSPWARAFRAKGLRGRAGPTGLHLYYRLADRQSSQLVTFDSKTASNEVLGHLEPYEVPEDYVSNYFLALATIAGFVLGAVVR